jgi:hypothetical protein
VRRPGRRNVAIAGLVVIGLLGGALAWWLQPQPLLPEADASLASTSTVTFTENGDRLTWSPAAGGATTGLIVYPGGKVPPAAYGPLAQAIAGDGYLVEIVAMPLNLAVLGIGRADETIKAHPEIEHWVIGGHSLGGSMAAQYASEHLGVIDGLAFWAAYGTMDLSGTNLAVLSIWGSLDAGAPRMGGPESRSAVPADAVFIEIEGGNHEQMGWYTGQPNDPPAAISREEQQRQVAAATIDLLESVEPAP